MKVTTPGIYDMPSDTYHSDPAETPSLSAGMTTELLSAPAKCFDKSIRLNPDYEEEEKQDKFTIGTVSHIMFLEPHLFAESVVVCDYEDWRKKEAQAERNAARLAGKTPILAKQMEKVLAARKTFFANDFTANAFAKGKFEQSLFWIHPISGIWCRARADFLVDDGSYLNDYKATANANPADFDRHAYNMGYHRRAAWYLEGAEILLGKRPDHYWFCNQEIKRPYLTSVVELDVTALEAGKAENDRAAAIFAKCLATGKWPGYRHAAAPNKDIAFKVGLPNYAYIRMDERNFV